MSDLTEFLLARLTEDEAVAREWDAEVCPGCGISWGDNMMHGCLGGRRVWLVSDPQRWLTECEAKRRIVAEHPLDEDGFCYDSRTHSHGCKWLWPCPTLRLLALPYSDHPDYRAEWRP